MTRLPAFLVLSLAPLAVAHSQECAAFAGDRIEARDLAALVPAFAALPPDTPIAPAPLPGVRRHFGPSEIAGLAQRYNVQVTDPAAVCFLQPVAELHRAQVLDAMQKAFADVPGARIEIVELSRTLAPSGRIEFRREQLAPPADPKSRQPVLWRGDVVYGAGRRFSIWARVLVSASVTRIVAAEKLARGVPIAAAGLRVETSERFPGRTDAPASIDQVAGRVPLRDIAPGAEIRLSQIVAAPEIARGDVIRIEVRSGAARLLLSGRAESAGRAGELIPIRNLTTNKIFQARVEAKGKAFLDAGLPARSTALAQTN